jgi:N-acetylglutamate synthase-like GNAT family acetyltransferase
MNQTKLILLKQQPELIPMLAHWHYLEWGALFPEKTEADFAADLADSLNEQQLPISWVVVYEHQVVGTASLLLQDMQTNRELSPWLANIYLAPSVRGKGLGKWLVQQVMTEARQLGLTQLYLFTEDQAAFYQRLGWQVLKQELYEGKAVTIMSWCCQALPAQAEAIAG